MIRTAEYPTYPTRELTKEQFSTPTPKECLLWSYKRAKKLNGLRKKNMTYARAVNQRIVENAAKDLVDLDHLSEKELADRKELATHMTKYHQQLCGCGARDLFRQAVEGSKGEVTLISALTCSHRLCNICNMRRANKMRRKWRAFFADTERNVKVRKAQLHFFQDREDRDGFPIPDLDLDVKVDDETGEAFYYTSGYELMKNFDFMHLILTVSHGENGWNGKEYYAKELLANFNVMRKADWWKETIFGGELSVETTRNKLNGGLHVHIHAMVLVDKTMGQSRNFLYRNILRRWNALTVDHTRPESEKLINPETPEGKKRWDGLRKSLFPKKVDPETWEDGKDPLFEWMLDADLDGRGSTHIGIKSLFFEIKESEVAKRGKDRCFQDKDIGKWFAYCSSESPKSMLKGVIECLKYHFEPCVLEDGDGNLDLDFLEQVLLNMYRQRLYAKFGGFYGVTQLNVIEEPLSVDDAMQDFAETARGEAFDPATGQPCIMNEGNFRFVIADSLAIRFDSRKLVYYLDESRIKERFSGDIGIVQAVRYLAFWGYKGPGRDG